MTTSSRFAGRATAICAIALFTLAACASETDRSPRERFEAEYGAAVCDVAWPRLCGERGGPACTFAAGFVPVGLAMLEGQGGVFDEAAAARCLEAIRGPASVPGGREVRCGGVMRGRTRPGGACRSTLECAPSELGTTWCRNADQASDQVCELLVRAAVDEPCVPAHEDAPSAVRYVCDPAIAQCDHALRRCVAKPGAGEPCRPFPADGALGGAPCRAGFLCAPNDFHCRPGRSEGEACSGSALPCGPGLRCNESLRCVTPARAPFEPCVEDADCREGTCRANVCDPRPRDEAGDLVVRIGCGG